MRDDLQLQDPRPDRRDPLRRLRLLLVSLFFAFPVLGAVISLVQVVRDGIAGVDGLNGVTDVALSADGRQLYAVSDSDDALAVFHRDVATGLLTFSRVHVDGVDGLAGASALALGISHGYAAGHGDDAVATFELVGCQGDPTAGDADRDGVCANLDCDESDPTNACAYVFADGFESGDTSVWSAVVP